MTDKVKHPTHYNARGGPECLDIIEAWSLTYHEGNVVKYLYRAPFKGRQLEDLRKARVYLDRMIALAKSEKPPSPASIENCYCWDDTIEPTCPKHGS